METTPKTDNVSFTREQFTFLQGIVDAVNDRCDDLRRENKSLQESLNASYTQCKELREENKALQNSLDTANELKWSLDDANYQCKELLKDKQELQDALDMTDTRYAELRKTNTALEAKIAQLVGELAKYKPL